MNKIGAEMVAMYQAGKTVKEVACAFGISVGKTHQLLRNSGCVFRRTGHKPGWKPTPESIEKMRTARLGKKMSPESKRKLSETKKCEYNGLNGYGHTKNHCRGYVLAYAPLHPHAHADGYIMLHTILMEQHIGRYLNADEVVHHKNRIRNDNRICNLELMNKKAHCSMHMRERNTERMISY